MNSYETPLVLFTVFSQLSVGMVALSAVRLFAGPEPPPGKIRSEWLVAGVVLLAGMIASVFHLGHPAGMVRALSHLGSAWLSREALSVGLFLALVVVGIILMRQKANRFLIVLTALVGLLTLFSMGMTYSPPSFPAINNVLPFVFFVVTAVLLGSSVGTLFAPEDKKPLLNRILTVSLIVGLVLYLIVPCIWLSGGEVMRETGQSWLASPLYWARIIVGLALPLIIVWITKKTPAWLWAVVLAGELMGRALFFANTVHTAANMGGVY
jgi:DMSO reductase anchor subunit